MSISTQITELTSDITEAYASINSKGGTIPAHKNTNNLADAIDSIPSGGSYQTKNVSITTNGTTVVTPDTGYDAMSSVTIATAVPSTSGPIVEKDVNYIDYDGTLLYSYSAADFLQLTSHPALPNHEQEMDIYASGWATPLETMKSMVQSDGWACTGALYSNNSADPTTVNREIRLRINITDENYKYVAIKYVCVGDNRIEWGDGTGVGTLRSGSSSSTYTVDHSYANTGRYTIKIYPATPGDNSAMFRTKGSSSYGGTCPYNGSDDYTGGAQVVRNYLEGVEIYGDSYMYSYYGYTFKSCMNLKYVIYGLGSQGAFNVSSGQGMDFYQCQKLKCVIYKYDTSYWYNYNSTMYSSCQNLKYAINLGCDNPALSLFVASGLKYVNICPNDAKPLTTNGNLFYQCYSLEKVKLRATTALGDYTFYNCTSLKELEIPMAEETTMTIGLNCFQGCWSLKKIKIKGPCTQIGNNAFKECYALTLIDLSECTSVPKLFTSPTNSSGILYRANLNAKIVVPDDLYDTWIAAQYWNNIPNMIVKHSTYYGE